LTNVIVTSFGERCNLVRESKMFVKVKPMFRAVWEVSSEELCILASWFLSPMSKNSVLEELRVRRLAVIQEEMC